MKKFSNIILIIALALVVLGNILYWGPKLYKNIKADELSKDVGSHKYEIEGYIDSVEAVIQAANVEIKIADSFSCYIENMDLSKSDVYVSEGKLHINAQNRENMEVLGWNIGNIADPGKKAKVTIYITKDVLRSFKLELGCGSIDAESIGAENLVIQLGTGNLSVMNLNVAETGALQLGTGSIKIYSLDAKNLTAKAGVGDVDIKLAADAAGYSVSSSIATGRMEIFDTIKRGISQSVQINGNSAKNLKIESGLGNITVK
ncbi:MAG: DUF4097 domain-containing protein [Lachnospiraceae bacterium]|nr:DUF4097 domain-containing protein [Lachnospiraceae bacterium]